MSDIKKEAYVEVDKNLRNKINRHKDHIEDYANAVLLDRREVISEENKNYEDINGREISNIYSAHYRH